MHAAMRCPSSVGRWNELAFQVVLVGPHPMLAISSGGCTFTALPPQLFHISVILFLYSYISTRQSLMGEVLNRGILCLNT
jgi:hypothetical protein